MRRTIIEKVRRVTHIPLVAMVIAFGCGGPLNVPVEKTEVDFEAASVTPPTVPPYKDTGVATALRVQNLIENMTLEEKVAQLSGKGRMITPANERLGIPPFKMTDGPVGVGWKEATAFPASVALASTWDTALIEEIGRAIGRETKERGRDVLLAPCVNLHRFPIGGRNFESFGEDPYLAGEIAKSYVKGVQGQGVIACIKHFAANNQEWNRMKLDVEVDERTLREMYLPMFKSAVVEAGVKCVMSAYNKVNGQHCTENPHLLKDILKDEWGFTGFVVSDWGAVESTVPSANAGNDLEMPRAEFWGDKLLAAVQNGEVSEAEIDDKLRRVLTVRMETGAYDRAPVTIQKFESNPKHESLALEAAKAGIVLLKNEPNLLPLDRTQIKSIALVGPNAKVARTGGGGSSEVVPFHEISPYEGLQQIVGNEIELRFARGTAPVGDVLPIESKYLKPAEGVAGKSGLLGKFYRNNQFDGEPEFTRIDPTVNFNWGYSSPFPEYGREFSVRWTGKLVPPKSGKYKFIVIYDDGIHLAIGDDVVIDDLDTARKRANMKHKEFSLKLKKGKAYRIELAYVDNASLAQVQLGWEIPGEDPIKEAAKLARRSDVAIVFAGLSKNFESEDKDRDRLDMPNQDKLIAAVRKANPHTVVVITTGTPVTMGTWHKNVPAIMQAWFPGQEGGRAVAELLLGMGTPSGKLPCSFIAKKEHCPAFKGYRDPSLKASFHEGIFVGYRYLEHNDIAPLFPFGHGLSYATFAYSNLNIKKGDAFSGTVTLDVQNTGDITAKEIVQLYVGDRQSSVDRPKKELKSFRKVELAPGETKTVSMELDKRAFSFYDVSNKTWKAEPGIFDIYVGSSSEDIRLEGSVEFSPST